METFASMRGEMIFLNAVGIRRSHLTEGFIRSKSLEEQESHRLLPTPPRITGRNKSLFTMKVLGVDSDCRHFGPKSADKSETLDWNGPT